MLQPFAVADETSDAYRRYVRSSFPLHDASLDRQREELIDSGLLWQEPFVSLARPGTTGPKLSSLSDLLLEQTLALPWGFEDLYAHQYDAIQRLAPSRQEGPESTLVLSGTGSGKTESFLIPIADACLRDPGPGIKALLIYPMNALANDQLKRLVDLLRGCAEVTFGRYTGDTPETDEGDSRRAPRPGSFPGNGLWSRQAMRDTPPNIFLTNYTQLEYLLLRGKDKELFRYGRPTYLVVDEIHLFTGVLGAELANLLRRFRQHVDAEPGEIAAIGTSATAGTEEEEHRLLDFARRFFGVPFDAGAAIAEKAAPYRPAGDLVPPEPGLTTDDLREAHDAPGLARLAKKVFGVDLPSGEEEFGAALEAVIDDHRTVSVVERALDRPAPVMRAAEALGELPERAGANLASRYREALALLLLGAAARQPATGEGEPEPRFRPRVHQVVRSLAGLWQCVDPLCGKLVGPGEGRCPICGAATLPLASCRTCGEAYWSSATRGLDLSAVERLQPLDRRRTEPGVFVADPARLKERVPEDEEGGQIVWDSAQVCPNCLAFAVAGAELRHAAACQTPRQSVEVLASPDYVHCPACGDQGARNRPILLPVHGSAAASVAVLTQSLSDTLRRREGEAGGRLLVFTDSRQDAGQQAGYADDQGARIAVRQVLAQALSTGPINLAAAIKAVRSTVVDDPTKLRRWLIGEADRRFAEVAHPEYEPSNEDQKRVGRQLEWEVALEVTERSRRRFSLEQEGLLVVAVDRLDELSAAVEKSWPDHPFGSRERLGKVIAAFVDAMRYARAVDHWMLEKTPRALTRNHGIRIGDRGVTSTRGWAPKKFRSGPKQVDIRSWTADRYATRMSELVGRVLGKSPADVNEVVEALAARLQNVGLLTKSSAEGRTRQMVDHQRLVLRQPEEGELTRCSRCGKVRGATLTSIVGKALCVNWRCPGTPEPFTPSADRDFYRRQYESPPRRLIVREHSGQIEGEERLALEERFNDRSSPTVDALACTPTLEVGVSLDDLHAVMLRNLPPTPANYAQRVGRAGRRSKVALAFAHAGQAPHDAYFFDNPAELIAGHVHAPAISLDNEPLLRRHANSLIFETLGLDLPDRWVPPLEDPDHPGATIADEDGVLRESAIKPFAEKLADPAIKASVEEAVRGAFASPLDPAPPEDAERICSEQVECFVDDLRAALGRWCDRYRGIVEEYTKLRNRKGIPSQAEKDYEARLYSEIQRLAQQSSPEYQPLGFLGLVGFFPRYGFTGETVLLHLPVDAQPISQAASVAVTEFAPANLVYARGRKLKVRRLDPTPIPEGEAGAAHRDNVLREGRRCDACEFLTFDPLVKACPSCHDDLVTQQVVELTGVRGSGGAISSEDEFRTRAQYDVVHLLGGEPDESKEVGLGGLTFTWTSGREVIVANRGVSREDDDPTPGFELCTGCGYAAEGRLPIEGGEEDEEADERSPSGHAPGCPGEKDTTGQILKDGVWLSARVRGHALEIPLPEAARGAAFASWRATLAEALKLGIRETMQAGQRDLDSFVRHRDREPWSVVVYDTMPGGTGYLPKLLDDEAQGLKLATAAALERLESCSCQRSCHRCLQEFWNQRIHHLLDRFQVMGTLRRFSEGVAKEAADPENEKLESFLELEFFSRLQEAGLPTPTLQVVRQLGKQRIVRADAEYRDPDVSIFLDGREYHAQSAEKVASDLDQRNQLEDKGVLVLEFTFTDVMERFDSVIDAVKQGLEGRQEPQDLDPSALDGLKVEDVDVARGRLIAAVDPETWIADADQWQAALEASNRARLAGWRLHRGVAAGQA